MKLTYQYEKILEKSLEEKIPGWSVLSPLDPVKTLVEGMAASFAQVEARQTRILNLLLSSLPEFFDFHAKPADASRYLFQGQASARLLGRKTYPKNSFFRIEQAGKSFQVLLQDETRIDPISELNTEKTEKEWIIRMKTSGVLDDLSLYFLRKGETVTFDKESIQIQLFINEQEINSVDLLIVDQTQGLTQNGYLNISLKNKAPLSIKKSEIKIKITKNNFKESRGDFYFNAFSGSWIQTQDWLEIGNLKGEPWEELLLPQNLLDAPECLMVELVSGDRIEVKRIREEILRKCTTERSSLNGGFIYNSSSHSVAFPDGDLLLRTLRGGAHVLIQHAQLMTEAADFKKKSDWVLGEFEGTLEKINPIQELTQAQTRESRSEYFDRFYAGLRRFHRSEKNASVLTPREISYALLQVDPNIRVIENHFDAAKKKMEFFILGQLGQESRAQMDQLISERIPLDMDWRISPFQTQIVGIDLKVSRPRGVNFEVESSVKKYLQDLFSPAPLGNSHESRILTQEDLRALLENHFSDLRIDSCHLTLNGNPERIMQLSRPSGVFYKVHLNLSEEERHAN